MLAGRSMSELTGKQRHCPARRMLPRTARRSRRASASSDLLASIPAVLGNRTHEKQSTPLRKRQRLAAESMFIHALPKSSVFGYEIVGVVVRRVRDQSIVLLLRCAKMRQDAPCTVFQDRAARYKGRRRTSHCLRGLSRARTAPYCGAENPTPLATNESSRSP
jgi:hypothetical protein